jgi:hypothetical protein
MHETHGLWVGRDENPRKNGPPVKAGRTRLRPYELWI